MTVYVVTAGSYSDYHIEAVFSSEEKAQAYIGNAPDSTDYAVNEYKVDVESPLVWSQCWQAHLRADGGDAYPQEWAKKPQDLIVRDEEHVKGERGSGSYDEWSLSSGYWRKAPNTAVFHGKSYVSLEHAHKLAVEQRQKVLREHPEWLDPGMTDEEFGRLKGSK
jgi:hypothetical protein